MPRDTERSGGSPLVGVVIAAYQAEDYLAAALQSVLDQTHGSWECVVVDDGSSDATAAVAAAFGHRDERVAVVRQDNAGVSAARNAGLAHLPAAVDFVCFLDSDDLLLPDAFRHLLAGVRDRPDAVGVSGWAELIDGEGRPIEPGRQRRAQSLRPVANGLRTRYLTVSEDTTFDSLLLHGSISPPGTGLVRRAVAAQIGGFDEHLACREDGDFWLRAARSGPIVFVDRHVAWYRRHPANATHRTAECVRAASIVRHKAWTAPDNTPGQRRAVLAANVRALSWELPVHLRRFRRSLRARRAKAALWSLRSAVAVLGQMLLVRPTIPSRRAVEVTVARNDEFGFDRSGRW